MQSSQDCDLFTTVLNSEYGRKVVASKKPWLMQVPTSTVSSPRGAFAGAFPSTAVTYLDIYLMNGQVRHGQGKTRARILPKSDDVGSWFWKAWRLMWSANQSLDRDTLCVRCKAAGLLLHDGA